MTRQAHDIPSDVAAEEGFVYIDGPGNLGYSMTPDAASETSDRLLKGAVTAEGQRYEVRREAEERAARHAPPTS